MLHCIFQWGFTNILVMNCPPVSIVAYSSQWDVTVKTWIIYSRLYTTLWGCVAEDGAPSPDVTGCWCQNNSVSFPSPLCHHAQAYRNGWTAFEGWVYCEFAWWQWWLTPDCCCQDRDLPACGTLAEKWYTFVMVHIFNTLVSRCHILCILYLELLPPPNSHDKVCSPVNTCLQFSSISST